MVQQAASRQLTLQELANKSCEEQGPSSIPVAIRKDEVTSHELEQQPHTHKHPDSGSRYI